MTVIVATPLDPNERGSWAPGNRRQLRAAGAGQSGRTDISERIEELLADEVKR